MYPRSLFLVFTLCAGMQLNAQSDSTGLPGDHFDLYGALDLFKQSASPEDFEKKLNDENNQVNNLDLDEDGNVDYIRVVDDMEGDAHAIRLQVAVSETESQDIAAIEVEKTGDASADLQIVGDEELYGENYIVEPTEEETAPATQQKWQGFRPVVAVNVWLWPGVRFIFAPAYVVWVSPWHYRHYPAWWRPWHPVAWRVHHARVVRYHHPYYHCVHVCRVTRAHAVYHAHRAASPAVHRRYEASHQRQARVKNGHPAGKAGASPKNGKAGPKNGPKNGPKRGPGSGSRKGGGGPRH